MQKLGVKEGDRIGIYAHKSIAGVAAIWGVLKAGAAYVPMDPVYPAERIVFQLTDSAARLILCETALLDTVDLPPGCEPVLLDRERPQIETELPDAPNVPVKSSHLAYIIQGLKKERGRNDPAERKQKRCTESPGKKKNYKYNLN